MSAAAPTFDVRLPTFTRPVRKLIRTDGAIIEVRPTASTNQIALLIGASILDVVPLRHLGEPLHVMMVDDVGHAKGLPVNDLATQLYHANCYPGTTHEIRGDVVILPDGDFGGPL